jgi:serine phosphatase RsbU (regulator of sigma subunit)
MIDSLLHPVTLVGVFATFSFIHLVLFAYYPKQRSNLYFGMLSGGTALLVFADQGSELVGPELRSLLVHTIPIWGTLVSLSGIAFGHELLGVRRSRAFTIFALASVPLIVLAWLATGWPFALLMVYWTLGCLELVRIAVVGAMNSERIRFEGAWVILVGFVPASLAGIYQFSAALGVIPSFLWDADLPMPYYMVLILMASMSIFIGRSMAATNRDLGVQLEQVQSLSEKTLRQEVERVRLESENERTSLELEEARQLQLSMLPRALPSVDGLDIAVRMITATEVGGDYYDFDEHDDGSLTIAIGDATGHGMRAGTMVVAAKALFRSVAPGSGLGPRLTAASRTLRSMGFGRMNMALTLLRLRGRAFEVASAGMPFPLVRRSDGAVDEIATGGPPLGTIAAEYPVRRFELDPGDTLLLTSDGLPELMGADDEMVGYERLARWFQGVSGSAEAVLSQLEARAGEWRGHRAIQDDITLVVIRAV